MPREFPDVERLPDLRAARCSRSHVNLVGRLFPSVPRQIGPSRPEQSFRPGWPSTRVWRTIRRTVPRPGQTFLPRTHSFAPLHVIALPAIATPTLRPQTDPHFVLRLRLPSSTVRERKTPIHPAYPFGTSMNYSCYHNSQNVENPEFGVFRLPRVLP